MAVRAPQARPPEPRARPGAAGAGRDRGEGTLSALATHSALGPPSAGTPPGGIGVYAGTSTRAERAPPPPRPRERLTGRNMGRRLALWSLVPFTGHRSCHSPRRSTEADGVEWRSRPPP